MRGSSYVVAVVQREAAAFDTLYRDATKEFRHLDKRAAELADQEYARLGSEPTGEDWDGDMADLAEQATALGQAFYERMFPLSQTLMNLFGVGLFHLFEQHLARLCGILGADGTTAAVDAMHKALKWITDNIGIDAKSYASFVKLNELALLANTVKHGEGRSAADLKQARPELFVHPGGRGMGPPGLILPDRIGLPLTGESVYVTESDYDDFSGAMNEFWATLAADLAATGH